VIDLHCHVLPGIDDGPQTMAGSLALARVASASGVRTLVATPHVSWRYPNEAEKIAQLVAELGRRLVEDGLALELRAGAEVAMTQLAEIEPSELQRLHIGDGEWLLLEPPFTPVAGAIEEIVQDLQRQGHRVVIAHPERCLAFHRDPELLGSLIRDGALTSITAGSLRGRFGGAPRRFALKLAHEEMVHNVASDAHDLNTRAPGMAGEIERAGLGPLKEWLTQAVPAAILGGWEIPPRPQFTRTRGLRRWRVGG
jgi:protein-tyrosine phosphatase